MKASRSRKAMGGITLEGGGSGSRLPHGGRRLDSAPPMEIRSRLTVGARTIRLYPEAEDYLTPPLEDLRRRKRAGRERAPAAARAAEGRQDRADHCRSHGPQGRSNHLHRRSLLRRPRCPGFLFLAPTIASLVGSCGCLTTRSVRAAPSHRRAQPPTLPVPPSLPPHRLASEAGPMSRPPSGVSV